MADVTIRDLRNHGGDVIDRVLAGEQITITKHGKPVVDLVRHEQRGTPRDVALQRARPLPHVDYKVLRAELDEILDPWLFL